MIFSFLIDWYFGCHFQDEISTKLFTIIVTLRGLLLPLEREILYGRPSIPTTLCFNKPPKS